MTWSYLALTIFDNSGGCGNVDHNVNSQCGLNSVPLLITNFIRLGLFIAGLLAVIFVIVGSLQYVTSAGNPERAKKARATITFAVIGMLLALFAFAIVNFIINSFLS